MAIEEPTLFKQRKQLEIYQAVAMNRGMTDEEAIALLPAWDLWERHNLTDQHLADIKAVIMPGT